MPANAATVRKNARRFATLAAVAALSSGLPAVAHELQDSRATLVMRDGDHLSMTLYLNLPEVLHRAIAPERSFAEFVLVYSSMDAGKFGIAVEAAQARLADATRLVDDAGAEPARDVWIWPTAAQTQAELRMLAAQLLTAPAEPPHDDPVEVRAEFLTSRVTDGLVATFPPEFDRVLVVSYRPAQVWTAPGRPSPRIRF
jgi:hypothetical protein